jgi:hypothetical protein
MSSPFDRFQRAEPAPAPTPAPSGARVLVPATGAPRERARQDADDAREAARLGMDAERLRIAEAQAALERERATRGAIPQGMRLNAEGALEVIPGAPNSGGRPLRQADAERLQSDVSIYESLATALNGFQDDYAGNTLTGDLENYAQGVLGTGTPGQRDWWARFRSTDNIIRNNLFGATLTPSEQAAYNATSVEPRMTASEVRRNIDERRKIIEGALNRRVAGLRVNYNNEEIDAYLGSALDGPQNANETPTDDRPGGPTSIAVVNEGRDDAVGAGERWTVGQEQALAQFVEQNAGRLTVPMLQQWYADNNAAFTPDARTQAFVDAVNNGDPYNATVPYDDSSRIAALDQAARDRYGDQAGNIDGSGDALSRGVADAVTLGFGDEIGGALNTAVRGGEYEDNRDVLRYLNERQAETNPYARTTGQVLGSVLFPTGAPKAGLTAGRAALRGGADMAAARTAAGTASRNRLTQEGAALGGAYGAGSSDGDLVDRITGGAIGATIGGAAGNVAGRIGNTVQDGAVARRTAARSGPPTDDAAFAAAAGRFPEVPVMPAAVPGRTGTQIATAMAESSLSGGVITKARDRATEALGGAVDDVAARMGTVADRTTAGEALQGSLNSWSERTQQGVTRLYDAIPINPNSQATVSATRAQLAEVNSRFGSNKALAELMQQPTMVAYQQALSRQGLSWQDLKAFRTQVGQAVARDPEDADVRGLYGALTRDMEASAQQAGPRAYGAWQRANTEAAERFNNIETIMTPLVGTARRSMSGEQTIARINQWASAKTGDYQRIARLIREIPSEDADIVRASLFADMGRATAGRQGVDGDTFSPATFMTNWNKMSDRARNALFDGPHRQAIDDVLRLAEGQRQSARFANTSGTARPVVWSSFLYGLTVNAPATLVTAGGGALLSNMLARPRSAQWLAALGRKPNEQAARAHIARLPALARTEPAIAADIQGLQRYLTESFAQSPMRAAASGEEE